MCACGGGCGCEYEALVDMHLELVQGNHPIGRDVVLAGGGCGLAVVRDAVPAPAVPVPHAHPLHPFRSALHGAVDVQCVWDRRAGW